MKIKKNKYNRKEPTKIIEHFLNKQYTWEVSKSEIRSCAILSENKSCSICPQYEVALMSAV